MPTPSLNMSTRLKLPIEAVSQKFAFLGRTGSGKTYAAGKLVELLLKAKAQVVILDPVGVWWGLRLAADGKAKGAPIPVLGGEHGDIPLEQKGGKLVADLVVDRRTSMVLDVSYFRKAGRKEFVTDFAEQLFHLKKRNRSPIHLVFEEAQAFMPQKVFRGGERMLGAMEDLVKIGRNYGIGASLISQRPQAVNKDVLNQTEILFVFQISGPQERKAIEAWIVDKGLTKDEWKGEIPSLPIGEAWVYSPQWLSVLKRLRIGKKWTYDASATPTFGAAMPAAQVLAPVDLKALKAAMADTIEHAKVNDPKELHKRIHELERDLNRSLVSRPEAVPVERVEVPVLSKEHRSELLKTIKTIDAAVAAASHAMEGFEQGVSTLATASDRIVKALNRSENGRARLASAETPLTRAGSRAVRGPKGEATRDAAPTARPPFASSILMDGLPGPRRRILEALVDLRAMGVDRVPRANVAVFSHQSPKSSAFMAHVAELQKTGLIDYPARGELAVTEEGSAMVRAPRPASTLEELHTRWLAYLGSAQARILEVLIAEYPGSLDRAMLAERAQQSPRSSAFMAHIATLTTLGAAQYPARGEVCATELLFPAGLR